MEVRWRYIHVETFQMVVQVLERRNSHKNGNFRGFQGHTSMGSIQYLILLVTTTNIDRKTAIDIYQCTGSVLDKSEISVTLKSSAYLKLVMVFCTLLHEEGAAMSRDEA